jgi:FkbM family methyltransferase
MSRLGNLRFLATCFDLLDPEERGRSARLLAGFYSDLVTAIKPEVVAEIGAFDASFSREIKRRLPDTHAIAFEANPYNYETFAPDAVAAGVEYVHTAVSDSAGFATFNIIASHGDQQFARVKGVDSLLQRTFTGVTYEQVAVPATTADIVFGQSRFATGRVCLWIDVEGAIEKVLRGATQTLYKAQSIMVEVEDYAQWEGQWLSANVDAVLAEYGFFPIARDFEYEHQYNVIYVKTEVTSNFWYDQHLTQFFSALRK